MKNKRAVKMLCICANDTVKKDNVPIMTDNDYWTVRVNIPPLTDHEEWGVRVLQRVRTHLLVLILKSDSVFNCCLVSCGVFGKYTRKLTVCLVLDCRASVGAG